MNNSTLKIILAATVAAVIAPASVRAQEVKKLYILKGNEVVYSGPVSEIDSMIFYPPFSTGTVKSTLPAGKLTFMAYNLGADPAYDTPEEQMDYPSPADADGVTDSTVYGALFQWGRPADGHQLRTSATTTTPVSVAPPGHGNFILAGSTVPRDWLQPQNNELWGIPKTAHDPCPEGWRIPTIEEWKSIFDEASGNTIQWNEDGTKGIKFSPDGETYTLFLPAAGNRQGGVSAGLGRLTEAGANGQYWSTTSTMKFSRNGEAGYSNTFSNEYHYHGYSCRCVKE